MLPKIDVPIYKIDLPITNKTYNFRPFLVKEEKLLLMAVEAGDEKSSIETIKQVINNCCLDKIDIDTLPVVDLEYFFLNLRARSVGEEVELEYKCNNNVQGEGQMPLKCGNLVKVKVNLLDIKPVFETDHTNVIMLSDKLGIVMKYPSFKLIADSESTSEVERIMKMILGCIDYIYDENTVYYSKDIPNEELVEYIDNLTKKQFDKIKEFFNTLPKIKTTLNFKCTKCGYNESIEVEGIQNFLY